MCCVVFRELEAEGEMVMGWWEKHGGLPRSHITSIRRVQNQPLWTKYALKRAEIQASTPLFSMVTMSICLVWRNKFCMFLEPSFRPWHME